MLKLHVVHVGRHGYYVDGLQAGHADDFDLAVESPGAWTGPGTTSLGLQGKVDAETFGQVMEGLDPGSGRRLRIERGASSVAGFDLTFCAPKSVSLLEALAPREIARETAAGHDVAVAEAGAYLSRAAVGVRRGSGESRQFLPSTGMVAGGFRHRTSRALDPHLHTHLVAANMAQGLDGRWSAADGRRVFAHLRAAGAVYQATLRLELAQRLGAAWEVRPSGLGDVAGVDSGLRRLFSQRSAEIEEYVAVHYRGAPGRHPGAYFATRPEKDRTRSMESLVSSWKERAADFGFDLGDLTQVVGRGARVGLEPVTAVDPQRMIDRLVESGRAEGSMARRDLVALVASASPGGAAVSDVDATVDRLLTSVGTPAEIKPGRETRWRRSAVLAATREHGAELATARDRQRSATRAVDPERGRERSPDRQLDPATDRRRQPDRDRGMELGR
ncbi:MAG TPA: MobF family relaxase [Acidimicrobiales bacterium]|nr:MobF family relaxase [Acidimicrobiales bacterium]